MKMLNKNEVPKNRLYFLWVKLIQDKQLIVTSNSAVQKYHYKKIFKLRRELLNKYFNCSSESL